MKRLFLNVIRSVALLYQFVEIVASSNTAGSVTSPIRHWDASWAASCVQGTAIAVIHKECAILLIRSPATNVWRDEHDTSTEYEDLMGLSVHPLSGPSIVEYAPPWLSFTNSLCAMTGLASDIEHLYRILQRQVDNHYNIYDNTLTVHSMTESVSQLLQQAAQAKGGRPFGLQTLLVGGNDVDETKTFCLYTIDPSGSWQSWPWGTAIGKYAKNVRTEMAKIRKEIAPADLKEVLEQMMRCWVVTCKTQNVNIQAKEDIQVLILRKPTGSENCDAYKVKRDDVNSIMENVLSKRT